MNEVVLSKTGGAIAVLSLNRPEELNAINFAVIEVIERHLDRIEADARIRVVILTGVGDVAFSAGADIAEFSDKVFAGPEVALREFVRRGQRFTARIEAFPKPIIVAVNGLAFGGGCEVTEAAALAIASDRATFAKSEIKLGFAQPYGGTQRLPRLVGRKRALEMILTAEPIPAEQAAAFGLVNRVVPHADLMPAALGLAAKISEMPPVAVAAGLASVTRGLNVPINEGLEFEASQFVRAAATQDIREGINAFLEKRPAVFQGH